MKSEVSIKVEEPSFEQLDELNPDSDSEDQCSPHSLVQSGSCSMEQPDPHALRQQSYSHSSEQSGSHSLQKSGSHYGSTSTVFSAVGSPGSSVLSPSESGYGSGTSPSCGFGSDSCISFGSCSSLSPCFPGSSPNSSAVSISPSGSGLNSDFQNTVQGSAITFSAGCFENQHLSLSDYQDTVPSGQHPTVLVEPSGQPNTFGQQDTCPAGQPQLPHSGHVPLGAGLPSWDSNFSPPQVCRDVGCEHSSVHTQQNIGLGSKGHFHSNTVLMHTSHMQESGSGQVFQNGSGILGPCHQQTGVEHRLMGNFEASSDSYAMGTKTLYQYDTDSSSIVPVSGPHPQASLKQYSINASATIEMVDPSSSVMNNFNPSLQPSHANHSELQKLLTQQVSPSDSRNTTLPDAPLDAGGWAGDMPQLTGEDLEILDLVA